MNDIITVRGIVATEPRHLVTESGLAITSIRVASPSRRWDRSTSSWANGPTNWFTVTAFRSLAANAVKSLNKGDRVIVSGRLRIRSWQRDERSGTSVEIDAEGIGHDLAWGVATWMRVPRHVRDAQSAPGESPSVDPVTGEVDEAGAGAFDPHDDDPHEDAVAVPVVGRTGAEDVDVSAVMGMETLLDGAVPDDGLEAGTAPRGPSGPDDVLERAA